MIVKLDDTKFIIWKGDDSMLKDDKRFKLPLLITYALYNNKKIHKELLEYYELHKLQSYLAAKRSEFYNHHILNNGSIKHIDMSRKVLGLVEFDLKNALDVEESIILSVIKKGWGSIYHFIKNSKDEIDKNIFIEMLDNWDEPDNIYSSKYIIALILSKYFNKEFDDINFYDDRMKRFENSIYREKDINIEINNIVKDKERNKKAQDIVKELLEIAYDNKIEKVEDLNPATFMYHDILAKYCEKLDFIFELESLNLHKMTDEMWISKNEMIEVAYIYLTRYYRVDGDDEYKFIIAGLYIRSLIKAYKEMRDYYFENNRETLYIDLQSLNNKIEKLEIINQTLRNQIEFEKNEKDRLKNQYKETIEKENILLTREIRKLKDNVILLQKENYDLERFIDSSFVDNDDTEDMIEELEDFNIPKKRIVIAGGNDRWHNKLKPYFPESFIYLDGSNDRFDVTCLDNKEMVLIYTKSMSHSFYYKLVDRCKRQNIVINYIKSTSPMNLLKEVNHILSE